MEILPALTIKGPDGLTASVTKVMREEGLYQPASSQLLIESALGDTFVVELDPACKPRDVDKIISAFRFNPQWREHFRVFNKPHETTALTYQSGKVGIVDIHIAPYLQALNDSGYRTLRSCEGDDHPVGRMPWILFAECFPPELEKVWNRLGWLGLDLTVTPPPCRGFTNLYRKMFLVLLDDWMHGCLDETGNRYLIVRQELPALAPLPPMNEKAMADHQRNLTRRVKALNKRGHAATFDEIVKLHSGRDRYSTWKLDKLLKALAGNDDLGLIQAKISETKALQRALRWKLRGLDLDLIIRKYEVDQMITRSKAPLPDSDEAN